MILPCSRIPGSFIVSEIWFDTARSKRATAADCIGILKRKGISSRRQRTMQGGSMAAANLSHTFDNNVSNLGASQIAEDNSLLQIDQELDTLLSRWRTRSKSMGRPQRSRWI